MTINIDARHLFVGCVLVVRALAPVLPHWPQDPSYHHFADGRPLLGVANGWNVLSNLLLCAIGLVGLLALWAGRAPELEEPTRGLVAFEAMALVATAIGSMYFHYAPSNDTLLWDRLPMTLGFAGALGVAVAMRFSPQEGREALLAWLLLGVASMAIWRYTSNLMVYGVVQYGGVLALVLVVALARERAAADPSLGLRDRRLPAGVPVRSRRRVHLEVDGQATVGAHAEAPRRRRCRCGVALASPAARATRRETGACRRATMSRRSAALASSC